MFRSFIYLRLPIYLILFLVLFFTQGAQAQELKEVKVGQFLVASERLNDTPFKHAVVYVTQASEEGVYGLIINRPTGITMDEVITEDDLNKHAKDELYIGGPMHGRFLFVLSENQVADNMHTVIDNVSFGAGRDMIVQIFKEDSNAQQTVRTFAGFTSWGTEQLKQDVKSGNWLVVPGTKKHVFESNTKSLWKNLFDQWSGNWT